MIIIFYNEEISAYRLYDLSSNKESMPSRDLVKIFSDRWYHSKLDIIYYRKLGYKELIRVNSKEDLFDNYPELIL